MRDLEPQVDLPQGRISLPVEPAQLRPYLERRFSEALGGSGNLPKPAPPAAPPPRRPKNPGPPRPLSPNHHLWLNNGTWFVAYTIYPTPTTKERRRESLQTACVKTARLRRDELFARHAAQGKLAGSRGPGAAERPAPPPPS